MGGIQLKVIPEYDTSRMSFSSEQGVCFIGESGQSTRPSSYTDAKKLDPFKNPHELMLSPGDIIHVKDVGIARKPPRRKSVKDL